MKKSFFYAGILAAGLMTISTSCSKDEEIINAGDNTEVAAGEQVIVLDLQDTDVLSTKSRPLYSTTNQGAEKVTDVKLLVFKHATTDGEAMTLEKVLTINKWDQNSSDYNYGRKYTLKLEGTDKLTKGESYTILAVGQDESNTSATSFAPYKILVGTSFQESAYISALSNNSWGDLPSSAPEWNAGSDNGLGFLKTATRTNQNEAEIFSGISKPVTLNFDGGFTAEVLLKRQVAGVLGYFTKIPAFVRNAGNGTNASSYDAVKYIRLVASNKNTQIDLTHALGDQKDDATEVGKENVVNGFTAASSKDAAFNGGTSNAYVVYTIDLSKWFKVNNNGLSNAGYWYSGSDYTDGMEIPSLGDENCGTWVNAFDQANEMPRVATNSVLAGEFVIPFNSDKNAENNTFELQLLGTDGTKILKSWNVKLDDMSIDQTQGDNEYVFNIYRNHLYQIGQRGNGDNPTDPGTDPDKPQPLDKDQELTIKINDQWEFIHDMEIE